MRTAILFLLATAAFADTYQFVGASCTVSGTVLNRLGHAIDMDPNTASAAILGGCAIIPSADFAAAKFTPEELKAYPTPATWVSAPPEFMAKITYVQNVFRFLMQGSGKPQPPVIVINPPSTGKPDHVHVDSEVPTGAVDGVNADFTLAADPLPGSVHFYRNGMRNKVSVDYNISGRIVTFVKLAIPQKGDELLVDYRKVAP